MSWLSNVLLSIASTIGLVKEIGLVFTSKLKELALKTSTPIDDEVVQGLENFVNSEDYTVKSLCTQQIAILREYAKKTETKLDDTAVDFLESTLKYFDLIKV